MKTSPQNTELKEVANHGVAWMVERCLFPILCPLPPVVSKRTDPGVMRVRDLALPPISYSTQEI